MRPTHSWRRVCARLRHKFYRQVRRRRLKIPVPRFPRLLTARKPRKKQFPAIADKYSTVSPGENRALYERNGIGSKLAKKTAAENQIETAAEIQRQGCSGLAKMALASIYRGTNRAAEAIAIYKDISEHPTVTVPKSQAQLELAEMYERTDPQQATLIYQQLQKDDPHSPAAQVAGQKLTKAK